MIMALLLAIAGQIMPIPDPYMPYGDHIDSRKFVIIYDKNKESRILVSELTRDWQAKPAEKLKRWAKLQERLKKSVTLISRDELPEFRFTNEGYPYFRFGERGDVRKFPTEMFAGSGTSLLSLDVIVRNESIDLSSWRNDCYQVNLNAELSHVGCAIRWLAVSVPHELGPISQYYQEWGEADNIGFLRIQEQFSAYDGYPIYSPPELPEQPSYKFPWQDGYIYPPEIVPVLIAPPPPEELVP